MLTIDVAGLSGGTGRRNLDYRVLVIMIACGLRAAPMSARSLSNVDRIGLLRRELLTL
ncbi:MAG: hypothetical protein ACR2RE_01435 [Geminicoccaceae bacterium]